MKFSLLLSSYILSFFYIIFLSILYFSKDRLDNRENKIYKQLLIVNCIGVLIQLLCEVFSVYQIQYITCIITKLLLIYFIMWLGLFLKYVLSILDFKIARTKIIETMIFIFSIIAFFLPYQLYADASKGIYYTYGLDTNFTYFVSVMLCVIISFVALTNHKSITLKKAIPIYILIIFFVISGLIQYNFKEITIIVQVETFICLIMYFTIENPDVQMMSELYENKKLMERSNQDTSNFLFKMTQDIKKTVKDLVDVSKNLTEYKDIKEIKKGVKYINNVSNELNFIVNDALDVSNMTIKDLKIFDSRYNPANLFKEIEYRFEKELPKEIKLNYSFSKIVPTYLYGDNIKIKQAINSVLYNALNHTKEGEISLEVSAIIKYDVCRLIIDITDTGEGISIDEVNNILSLKLEKVDLTNKEILNLKETKKLVALLGGNLMVKSEKDVGTTVNIILEQKIVKTKETEISKKLEVYEQTLYKNKRVMVVDDDAKELTKITTYLEKMDAEVSGSLFGRDCIEKINSNMKYDLILLDDETNTYSAFDVLKELKENKKFNIPVVIMINDNKEFIKLHYLQDGFSDVLLKSKLESEISRIMKRF